MQGDREMHGRVVLDQVPGTIDQLQVRAGNQPSQLSGSIDRYPRVLTPPDDLHRDVDLGVTVLDLVGGADARRSAQLLVGTGLLTAGPTAWTGWAQWVESGEREKRVGLVHAVTNGVAIGAYAASWVSRRRGDHARGVGWALAGAALSSVGGYLGSHLVTTRKVATHDPAFD